MYKSLTNVEALQHLYQALGGDPKTVKSIDLIHVMIDRIADYVKEHGGGGVTDVSLATKEEVEEVAEEVMSETMDDYAYNWLQSHSEDFLATETDVHNTADEIMGMSFNEMCEQYLNTHSDEFLASKQEVENVANELMNE